MNKLDHFNTVSDAKLDENSITEIYEPKPILQKLQAKINKIHEKSITSLSKIREKKDEIDAANTCGPLNPENKQKLKPIKHYFHKEEKKI